MTYREALRLIVSEKQEDTITSFFCPSGDCPEKCVGCWDREMPELPKEDECVCANREEQHVSA